MYQNVHALPDSDSLFKYIQNYSTRPGGVSINHIKQNYTGNLDYKDLLAQWEQQGKILIMRFAPKAIIAEPGAKPRKVLQARGEDGQKALMDAGTGVWKSVVFDQARAEGVAPVGQVDEGGFRARGRMLRRIGTDLGGGIRWR
jgi:hypothetical protein